MTGKKSANPQASSESSKLGSSQKKGDDGVVKIAAECKPVDAETLAVPDLQPINRASLLKKIYAAVPLPIREEACADGSHVYVGGDPAEVVVRVSNHQITVSAFAIKWEGADTPVVCPQPIMSIYWKRLPAIRLTTILHEMIEAAGQLRRAKYRNCERCGETKPPEWMHKSGMCQSCAEQRDSVVC